jgi:hypothetical protein
MSWHDLAHFSDKVFACLGFQLITENVLLPAILAAKPPSLQSPMPQRSWLIELTRGKLL